MLDGLELEASNAVVCQHGGFELAGESVNETGAYDVKSASDATAIDSSKYSELDQPLEPMPFGNSLR